MVCIEREREITMCFFVNFWVTGELSTLRQVMKIPYKTWFEPERRPRKDVPKRSINPWQAIPTRGQANFLGAKTTSHDGMAGHVITHVCHRGENNGKFDHVSAHAGSMHPGNWHNALTG